LAAVQPVFFGVNSAVAAPGDPDPSFGKGGTVVVSLSPNNDWIEDIAVQPDGKIVAVGHLNQSSTGGNTSTFVVVRLLPGGALDSGFGNGGIVTTRLRFGNASARGVALQPDGKIVVCGNAAPSQGFGVTHLVVARYFADGRPVPAFSGDGVVESDPGPRAMAKAVKVQPDGKILVAGSVNGDTMLLRYTPDGSPDRRFGLRGRIVISNAPPPQGEAAYAVLLQPDQKILLAGDFGNQSSIFAARLQPYGKIDASFDGDGLLQVSFGDGLNVTTDCELQPDGKIVVAGFFLDRSTLEQKWTVTRLDPDGSFDTTFDGDGRLELPVNNPDTALMAVELQPDGKIVLGGSLQRPEPADLDFLLMRRNPDGSPDTSFGRNGQVETNISPIADQLRAMKIQPDGKIVAAGFAVNPTQHADFALARYLIQ
jgi:uncharacterized delta-60 repeat protein